MVTLVSALGSPADETDSASPVAAPASDSPAAPPVATNRWTFHTGAGTQSAPAIGADGTVYVATQDGQLWAVSPEGRKKWVYNLRSQMEIHSSPAIGGDGTVYFGSRDRHLYAVDAAGKEKWDFATGAWVDSSPALARDGSIYFGSWDHTFYALGPDGRKKWSFDAGAPVVSSPVITADGTICFGSHNGRFYALQPDGALRWQYAAGGAILSSAAVSREGVLYFTSVNGDLHAVNADGSPRWRLHTGSITRSSPVIAPDGALYLGVNRELWCISSEGKQIWGRGNESAIEAAPIAYEDLSVSYIHGWGVLMSLDRDRKPLWGFQIGGAIEPVPAVGTNGTIYICASAELMARGPVQPMARSSWPCFRANTRNTGNVADNAAAAP